MYDTAVTTTFSTTTYHIKITYHNRSRRRGHIAAAVTAIAPPSTRLYRQLLYRYSVSGTIRSKTELWRQTDLGTVNRLLKPVVSAPSRRSRRRYKVFGKCSHVHRRPFTYLILRVAAFHEVQSVTYSSPTPNV